MPGRRVLSTHCLPLVCVHSALHDGRAEDARGPGCPCLRGAGPLGCGREQGGCPEPCGQRRLPAGAARGALPWRARGDEPPTSLPHRQSRGPSSHTRVSSRPRRGRLPSRDAMCGDTCRLPGTVLLRPEEGGGAGSQSPTEGSPSRGVPVTVLCSSADVHGASVRQGMWCSQNNGGNPLPALQEPPESPAKYKECE